MQSIEAAIEETIFLPFDQYQRYRMIHDMVNRLRTQGELLILDVGGSPGTLQRFLPTDRVIVADLQAKESGSVCASGLSLPFADGSFEIVVSSDTLEHIPRDGRELFLRELSRVAEKWLIVAAPFDSPAVVQAEEILSLVFESTQNEKYHFLEEHRIYGLPRLDETLECLKELGFRTIPLPNGYLYRWLLGLSFFFLVHWRLPRLKSLDSFNKFYNSYFYQWDNREPSYRHVIVAAKGSAALPRVRDLIADVREDNVVAFSNYQQTLALLVQAIQLEMALSDTPANKRIRELESILDEWSLWQKALVAQRDGLDEQVRSLTAAIQSRETEVQGLTAAIQSRETEVQALSAAVQSRETEVQRLTDALGQTKREAWRLTQQNSHLDDRNASLEEAVRWLQGEVAVRDTLIRGITNGRIWRLATPVFKLHRFSQAALSALRPRNRPTTSPIESKDAPSDNGAIEGKVSEIPVSIEQSPNKSVLPVGHYPDRHDILCFSIVEWEFRFQRPQQIAKQFADEGHRVFYLSLSKACPPEEPSQFVLRALREGVYEIHLPEHCSPNVYGRLLPEHRLGAFLESIDSLRKTHNIVNPVMLVQLPFWAPLAVELRRRFGWNIIYDCMDEWNGFPGWDEQVTENERTFVEECDLLLVSAQKLVDKWGERKRDRCLLVRNGADFAHYEKAGPNDLLTDIERPIIGYFGGIAAWFDPDLLEFLARRRPHYTFILVGGVFDVDLSRFEDLPNVHFLGQQPYELMPRYLFHFDVCTIPFKVNSITDATDPVKFYEYISLGKPVVAPKMPELFQYRDFLYIAEDYEDFLSKVDAALAETEIDVVHRRVQLARENTWEARVALIREGINRLHGRASIIVVTYNNVEYTRLCVESILRNSLWPNLEIIIIDNASNDGTRAYLRHLERTVDQVKVILNSQNLGFAHANNQGLAAASGEYLVLLNNDTIVPNGWLPRLLRHLDRDRQIGIVGPVTNFSGNETKVEVTYLGIGGIEGFAEQHMISHEGEVFDIRMLAMHCIALRRSVFEEVGTLDDGFEVGMFEDDDYSHRVRLAGYRVVCAEDVFIHHFGQSSFKKLPPEEYQRIWDRNRQRFEEKWSVEWIAHRHRTNK